MPDDLEQWLSLIDDENLIETLVRTEVIETSRAEALAHPDPSELAGETSDPPDAGEMLSALDDGPSVEETPEPAEESESQFDALEALEIISPESAAPPPKPSLKTSPEEALPKTIVSVAVPDETHEPLSALLDFVTAEAVAGEPSTEAPCEHLAPVAEPRAANPVMEAAPVPIEGTGEAAPPLPDLESPQEIQPAMPPETAAQFIPDGKDGPALQAATEPEDPLPILARELAASVLVTEEPVDSAPDAGTAPAVPPDGPAPGIVTEETAEPAANPEPPPAPPPAPAPHPLQNAVDLLRAGDLDRAAEAFWNAVEAKALPALANVGLGACLLRLGQPDAALHAFEDAIHVPQKDRIQGVNDHAWFGVAVSRLQLGQCKLAEDALNRVAVNQVDRDELRTSWMSLGAAYYEAAEYDNALRAFEFAHGLGGADASLEARLAAARAQGDANR